MRGVEIKVVVTRGRLLADTKPGRMSSDEVIGAAGGNHPRVRKPFLRLIDRWGNEAATARAAAANRLVARSMARNPVILRSPGLADRSSRPLIRI